MRKFLPILVAFVATHAFAVNEFYDLLVDHSQTFKSGATLNLTGVTVIGLAGGGSVTSVGADTSSTGIAITGSPVTTSGTIHINLAAGYVIPTSANIATWNGKQDALGFTPENVANKDVDGTLSANSDTRYPSQKAVKTYADTKVPKTTTVNGHALSGNISVTPTDLSLVIGTNVEAWSANLDSWGAKTPFAGSLAITTGKTFTTTNTLTLSGTDASTLNIGTGGTLGTAAFTAASAYEPAIAAGSTAQYWRGDKSFQTLNATSVGLGSVENAAASTLYVPLTRTVNGHALSANVTVTDSDLGATTIGDSMFKLTNPSSITFPRFNSDNTVSALSASAFRTAIGAGTSSFSGLFTGLDFTSSNLTSIATRNFSDLQNNPLPQAINAKVDYGAVGNGVQITNAAISSASATLTSASNPWTSGDTGKVIIVVGAGTSGADLVTTILTYNSTSSVTLANNAGTTVTGAVATFGTNDTSAIQNAINAAASLQNAKVFIPSGIYIVSGALQTTAVTGGAYNTQIKLPQRADTLPAYTLEITGESPASGPYLQYSGTLPQTSGTILFSTLTASAGTRPSVIGGPILTGIHFSSYNTLISNLTIREPTDPQLAALDLKQMSTAVVRYVTADVPRNIYNITSAPTNSKGVGVIMPGLNNQARIVSEHIYVAGFYSGLLVGEHNILNEVFLQSCYHALEFEAAFHESNILKATWHECPYGMVFSGGNHYTSGSVDIERNGSGPAWTDTVADVYDPSNYATGGIGYHAVVSNVGVDTTITKNGGTNLDVRLADNPTLVNSEQFGSAGTIFKLNQFDSLGRFDIAYPAGQGCRVAAPKPSTGNYSDGAGFQLFGGTDSSLPGQIYFDYGSSARDIAGRQVKFRSMSLASGFQDVLTLDASKGATFTGTVTIPTPFTLGAVSVTTTGSEMNFVAGVTSAIQAQLDGKQASGNYQLVSPSICNGRLTTESSVPISTSDRTAQSTIYFTPYKGAQIALYSGSTWSLYNFSEISLSLSGLTSGKNYDIFIYNNSGTLTLELSAAWTDDTTRADAISLQDGIYVKNSVKTRRYLGTMRTTGTTTTEDSAGGTTTQVGGKRFVWNYYNQVRRVMSVIDTTTNWSYATNTWRQADGNTGNKVEYVLGVTGSTVTTTALSNITVSTNTTAAAKVGIGLDSTTVNSATLSGAVYQPSGSAINLSMTANYVGTPTLGYHAMNWMEKGAVTGTSLFLGSNSSDGSQSGLTATIDN